MRRLGHFRAYYMSHVCFSAGSCQWMFAVPTSMPADELFSKMEKAA
jgi:hypothetical protein